MSEIFNGHLEQIDYQDDKIRALHLVSLDGQRLIVRFGTPEAEDWWEQVRAPRTGPLAFLARDARPPVTIEREPSWP